MNKEPPGLTYPEDDGKPERPRRFHDYNPTDSEIEWTYARYIDGCHYRGRGQLGDDVVMDNPPIGEGGFHFFGAVQTGTLRFQKSWDRVDLFWIVRHEEVYNSLVNMQPRINILRHYRTVVAGRDRCTGADYKPIFKRNVDVNTTEYFVCSMGLGDYRFYPGRSGTGGFVLWREDADLKATEPRFGPEVESVLKRKQERQQEKQQQQPSPTPTKLPRPRIRHEFRTGEKQLSRAELLRSKFAARLAS